HWSGRAIAAVSPGSSLRGRGHPARTEPSTRGRLSSDFPTRTSRHSRKAARERTTMLASSEKLEPIAPYVGQIVGRVERRASGAEQWLLVRCVGKSDNHVASVLKNAGISHYYPMIREFKPLPMRKLSA